MGQREFSVPADVAVLIRLNIRHFFFRHRTVVGNLQRRKHLVILFKGHRYLRKAGRNCFHLHQFFVGTALRLSNIIDLINTTPQIRDEIIVFQCTVFVDTTRNAADLFGAIAGNCHHRKAVADIITFPGNAADFVITL